jgi:2-methylisocitrate lyase-like PEP mutase family enzyme
MWVVFEFFKANTNRNTVLEGVTSHAEAKEACRILSPTPVLLNMVEHGATPSITPQEAHELGFGIIIFPFAAIAPAYYAIKNTMQLLKKTGKTGLTSDFTPKKLFSVVGLNEAVAIDADAGGSMYAKV